MLLFKECFRRSEHVLNNHNRPMHLLTITIYSSMSDIPKNTITLRSQNDEAPISKLMDKLLESVFLFLVPPWSSTGKYRGGMPPHPCFATSQVCSHWRQLSLGMPNLWKTIELRYGTLRWKEELIRRSMNASFIEIHSPDDDCFDEILDIDIPNFLPRIRFFEGGLSVKGWIQLFNGAQQPGALLEHLSIQDISEALEKPAELTFHGYPPPLRLMWMRHTDNINLTSPFFSNVRSMNIAQYDGKLTTSHLASIAANVPYLEKLYISAEIHLDNLGSSPIPFPCLKYLYYNFQELLEYIDIPAECSLDITCNWPNYDEAIAIVVARFIYDHTNTGNPSLTLHIYNSQITINNFNMFGTGSNLDIYRSHGNKKKDIKRERILLQDLAHHFTAISPMITVLNLQFEPEKYWEEIAPLLFQFTAVQTISFEYAVDDLVFSRLKQLYDDGSGPRMLFPSLKNICQRPDEYQWQGSPTAEFRSATEEFPTAEFRSYLAWRIEQGAPIESLKCHYWNNADNSNQDFGNFASELGSAYGIRVESL